MNFIGPRSVYGEAKRSAEAMTRAYNGRYGVPVRIIRIFNTYGPHMDPEDGRVVTNFIVQGLRGEPITIYGDGSQTRSFQYVDDLVNGIAALMNVDFPLPVNLGNPEEYTILQFAEFMGIDAPLEFRSRPVDDPRQRKPDIEGAKQLLGWEPVIPVRDGLRRTSEHFKTTLRPWEAAPPQLGTRERRKPGTNLNQVNTEAST